ncbi:hypothetical protein [Nonomuraea sp. NPDC005501]|uniref:hypothetical protein n=1 Tax=Nonomuraea sp. NPDC005501 TaxID=3156884 RepID=UPI0033A00D0A
MAIEEYKTLRDESLKALHAQQLAVQIGSTLLTAILAAAFGLKPGVVRFILLDFIGPIVGLFVVVVWRGEVERSIRAGVFLRRRELEISNAVKVQNHPRALSWERWLARNPQFRLWKYYRAQLVVLLGLASANVAAAIPDTLKAKQWYWTAFSFVGFALVVSTVVFYVLNETRLRQHLVTMQN